jgi:hypothetical protein
MLIKNCNRGPAGSIIAFVDHVMDRLKVGSNSAGAIPKPVCNS